MSFTNCIITCSAWSSSSSLLVHPSALYVGLKTEKSFVGKDEPIHVDARVFDIDGNGVQGTEVAMSMVRLDWEWKSGSYQEIETDLQECKVTAADEDQ